MKKLIKLKKTAISSDGENIFYIKHFCIFRYEIKTRQHSKISGCKLKPQHKIYYFLSFFNLTKRLFRIFPRSLCYISKSSCLFQYCRTLYFFDFKKNELILIKKFSNKNCRPLHICKSFDPNFIALFGEYRFDNKSVAVNGITSNFKIKKLFGFVPKEIRHIHNIIHYKLDEYLILTGDSDECSKIIVFNLKTKSIKTIVKGSQSFRACIGCILGNYFYYATDAVEEQNRFLSLNLKTKEVKALNFLNGSVIYGKMLNGSLIFSTTVEPTIDVKNKFDYYFTPKLGKGILSNDVILYQFNPTSLKLIKLFAAKKDFHNKRFFGYGFIDPLYFDANYIIFNIYGCKKYSMNTICLYRK